MQTISQRYNYLFRSTKGLALVAITMIALETLIFGMISGPMDDLGIRDVWVRITGMDLNPAEREGRIIILYHTIAMAVIAIETYFITGMIKMKEQERTNINAVVTVGYLVAMIFGMWFAYFGQNYVFHGLFIFGQSVMFFGGILLAKALWPWKKEYRIEDTRYSRTRGGLDLERTAFFVMALATLGSAVFGALAGSNFGGIFESFLAEDTIRQPGKTMLQMAVIGHLHIMLTLIAVALALIVGRWVDFHGRLQKLAMPLMIFGTITVTAGAWAVVPFREVAHKIIYIGSTPVLLAALFLVIYTWRRQIRLGLEKRGLERGNIIQKISALVHDPLPFGATWQMVYMNFVVTFVGIFMAIRLDEIIRRWEARDERITLTGHWHVLAAIIATIILLYYADLIGLKGKARQWFGWTIIIASDVAFAAVTVFSLKRLFVSEEAQQPLVNITMILIDAGLAIVLGALGVFLLFRLIDLLKGDGSWRKEVPAEEPPAASGAEVTK